MVRRLLINQKNHNKTAVIEKKNVRYIDIINKALALLPFLPHARENIGIFLPNGSDYIAAFWGVVGAGMTAFPLNILITAEELQPLLKHSGVKTIITSILYRRFFEEMAALNLPKLKIIYMEQLGKAPPESAFKELTVGAHEPMVLLNTSGTMGKCKIVQLSEKNVETSVLGYLDKLRLDEIDEAKIRYTLGAPFSSVYGIMILSACLIKSFPLVVLEEPFTLDSFFRTAEKHKITHYEGSTSAILLMEGIIGRHIPYDIGALTYFGTGGSMVSGGTIKRLQKWYKGKEFFHGYGMTEAAPLITKHPRDKVEKTESAGTAINGVEIAVEADGVITSTPYTKGEIVVKGPNIMIGYYDNEAETKKALKNGYLYTGDIGYLDEEGYLYLSGRKKNIIIVRGFNVYPEEVEECIRNSRLAKDCIVYGQHDGLGNEMVCADIVPVSPHVSGEDIKEYCAVHLAEYKRPRKVSFCENIERNVSGKPKRRGGNYL